MFDRLIESHPSRRRPVAQSLASIGFHLALGVGAIRATRIVAETAKNIEREQPIVLPAPARPSPVARTDGAIVRVDDARVTFPAPPPVDVPIDLGPIAAGIRDEPNQLPQRWWPAEPHPSGPTVATPGTFSAEEVDDPVAVVEQPKPVYPPVLQAAGISGSVDLQFVVDTLGRAEPSSWHVIGSTNRAFEAPARDAILAARYRPARIRGQPVRQLVAQRISFSVEP